MAERKKLASGMSPKGIFVFPKLTTPDYGNEKFPKPDGEYSLKLRLLLSSALVENFLKTLAPHMEEAEELAKAEFAKLKVDARKKLQKLHGEQGYVMNDLYATVYDKETEEETGEIDFKFAMKAGGEVKTGPRAGKKWSAKPALFDAKGQPITKTIEIWGGSTGKVSFKISPYFIPGSGAAGIKLMLEGVQLIDLVQGGQRSASSMGFGVEDGYSYDPEDAADEEENSDAENEGNDSSDNDAGADDF